MPSANGVYSLPTGYLAVTGSTILASQHNPPLEDIATALTLRLSRDGTAPMTGPLQMAPGTVTIPGAVFSTDLATGFYKTTTGVGVSVAGTQVAEFTAAGIASGARLLGELIPWTFLQVPSSLWAFPVGQTLSRAAYPKMWAKVQTEIAAGNSFYNNGNGSTTFGIGDIRGYVFAAPDGGASRIPINFGQTIGTSVHTLSQGELPNVSIAVTASGPISGSSNHADILFGTLGGTQNSGGATQGTLTGGPFSSGNITLSGTASVTGSTSPLGNGFAHQNMQPTLALNYIMFIGN